MIFVIQGDDTHLVSEAKQKLFSKYKVDDYNYVEFSGNLDIGDISVSMKQVPLMADHYLVFISLNKKQFIRLKDYFKPSQYTVLILQLTDFRLTDELKGELEIKQVYDCYSPRGRDLTRWVTKRCVSYGFSLDKEDRRYIALMFSSLKEIDEVLFQMSLLPPFDRQLFLKGLFNVRQKFVWDLFSALLLKKRRKFFNLYAEQYLQNLDKSTSQFNMKTIGGLIYCLDHWEDAPEWIMESWDRIMDDIEELIPFLYSEIMKIFLLAKKDNTSVSILNAFDALFDKF